MTYVLLLAVILFQPAPEPNKMVVFTASWCGPCQAMKREVYSRRDVQFEMGFYKTYMIDVDKHPEFAKKHGVTALPRIIIMDKQLKHIASEEGYMPPETLKQWLRKYR